MLLFFHGRESSPRGSKATWLARTRGAVTPQLTTTTVAAALPEARAALDAHRPALVVASSFGGAVAVALLQEGRIRVPVVLIAPAAAKLGVRNELPEGAQVVILHGDGDDVVPLADSVALAGTGGPGVSLRVVSGGDHRLNQILRDGTLDAVLTELGAPAR
jgi:alpha/beta superfamily hydrolase